MGHKARGFWIGAGLLTVAACAHTNTTASNNNTAGTQPTPAANDNLAASNANPQAGQTDQTGLSPDNGASSSGNSGTAADNTAGQTDNTALSANDSAGTSGSEGAIPPPDTGSTSADNTTTSGADSKNVAQQKSDIISSADGSQPGIVQDYSYGELTLAPQGKQHKGKGGARSVLSIDDKVPVFQGSSRASTNDLLPGTDVRVYYRNPASGTEKEVIGVEIIAPAPKDRTVTPDSATQPGSPDTTAPGTNP